MPSNNRPTPRAQRLPRPLKLATLALLALSLCTTLSASADSFFSNGSFESNEGSAGQVTTYRAGDTSLAGWAVGGSVDVVMSRWQNADGSQVVDLNGLEPGSVSQTVHTTPGRNYCVAFSLAGNPEGGDKVKTMNVVWDGVTVASPSFDTSGTSGAAMGYVPVTLSVRSNPFGGVTELRLESTTAGAFGPVIDNVRLANVSVVSEVSALNSAVAALNIPAGTKNSLLSKLDKASGALAACDGGRAASALTDFVNEVNAQRGKKIKAADADMLLAAAAPLVDKL
jgi:choice-of-anchor C domain-containing protein